MRTDPFRQLERLTQEAFGSRLRPEFMPMDAYRSGDHYVVRLDVPGVDPADIDLTVEKNSLTITAERKWRPDDSERVVASERAQGTFSRQLFLGDGLDLDRIEASYEHGVLTIRVPVAEQARPRKVEITAGSNGAAGGPAAIDAHAQAA